MTTIGLLNPGEMGSMVGAAVRSGGARVLWAGEGRSGATRKRASDAGLEDAGSVASVVAASDVILSVCPPYAAVDVATQVAALRFGGIFVDGNAVSPATAREIGTAEQLEEALAGERPGLVITDLALGWVSGLDVLRGVKGLDPHCPVIIFTGAGDELSAVEAMKAGASDYVIKDTKRLARLAASIRDVVGGRSSAAPTPLAEGSASPGINLIDQVETELVSVIDGLCNSAKQQTDRRIADESPRKSRRRRSIELSCRHPPSGTVHFTATCTSSPT